MKYGFLLATALVLAVQVRAAAAADFLVNSTGDQADASPGNGACATATGACTLRAAIQEANARPGLDYIDFSIGVSVLSPATAYPTITDDLVIDGRSSPGYTDTSPLPLWRRPAVFLDGSALATSTLDGLRVRGTSADPVRVEIHGLGITRFPQDGINLQHGSNAVLDANWIGIGRDGNAGSFGNGRNGMLLSSCTDCVVGAIALEFLGTPLKLGLGNAISGNGASGILMALGSGNTLGGNEIGPEPGSSEGSYSSGGGNGGDGIQLLETDAQVGMQQNLVVHARNIVLFNGGDGIQLGGSDHLLERNWVAANGGDGIRVLADDTTIRHNHNISGNGGAGVRIGTDAVSANRVRLEGAFVNQHGHAVILQNGSNLEAVENMIDAASVVAIQAVAQGALVQGNRIGGQLTGDPALAVGILVQGESVDVLDNTVVSADNEAILVEGSNTVVEGNLIGADSGGVVNGNGNGIVVTGDGASLRFNLVVDSGGDGVVVRADDVLVCGNRIGSVDDATPAGNGIAGIWVQGHDGFYGDYPPAPDFCPGNHVTHNATVGIEVAGDRNRVGNNLFADHPQYGVLLAGAAATEVLDNHLLGNVLRGIQLTSGTGLANRLQGNVFSGTALDIDLADDGPSANDPGDADTGPNRMMNHPQIVAVFPAGTGAVDLTYRMDVATGNATRPFTVDIYLEPDGSDIRERIHSDGYDLPMHTHRTIHLVLPDGVAGGRLLAMATDAAGNSSELASATAFSATPAGVLLFANGFED